VQTGETAYAISRKYNIGVQQLMKLNNIKNFDAIKVGQKLKVR
jgi:LysM repeat protein